MKVIAGQGYEQSKGLVLSRAQIHLINRIWDWLSVRRHEEEESKWFSRCSFTTPPVGGAVGP